MIPDKPFKTYDEQIEILKSRNVVIPDKNQAIQFLSTFSYYGFINGYKDLFPHRNDKFLLPISIYDFYFLSFLDRNLNNLFFKYIIIIEKELKTHISYRISEKYGVCTDLINKINEDPNDYLNKKNFKSTRSTNNIIKKIKQDVNESKNQSIRHYQKNHNHIPCWILINGISLGVTIELYNILLVNDKDYVCEKMIKTSLIKSEGKKEFFSKGIKILRKYRNNIAHGHRTFNDLIREELPKKQVLSLTSGYIAETDYKRGIGKNDIIAVVLVIITILDKEHGMIFIEELKNVFSTVSSITFSTGKSIYEMLSLPQDFINRMTRISQNLK